MFYVENNDIILTKGDSGSVNLRFKNRDGSEYTPKAGDEIVFSLKNKQRHFSDVILEKTGEKIAFAAEETEKLPAGEYLYDVVIKRSTGERYTAIEGKLIIRKAVHKFE